VARFLIVGAGSNAVALGDTLEREGHVVSVGGPNDRRALEHVAIVCWLDGPAPERFLLSSIDSSMRGFVYQAGGQEREVSETAALNSIPMAVLKADPRSMDAWLAEVLGAIGGLLGGGAASG